MVEQTTTWDLMHWQLASGKIDQPQMRDSNFTPIIQRQPLDVLRSYHYHHHHHDVLRPPPGRGACVARFHHASIRTFAYGPLSPSRTPSPPSRSPLSVADGQGETREPSNPHSRRTCRRGARTREGVQTLAEGQGADGRPRRLTGRAPAILLLHGAEGRSPHLLGAWGG